MSLRTLGAALLLIIGVSLPAVAQQKPILGPADFDRFESIAGDAVSPNGIWYAYRVSRPDADAELRYRRIDRDDSTRVVPLGVTPTFTADSRFLGWATEPSIKEKERLTKAKKPVQRGFTVLSLASGEVRSFEAVRAASFAPSGRFVALHGYAPTEIKGKGANLRIVNLADGVEVSFGDVGEYGWSDEGGLLAMTIATGHPNGNGIQIYEPVTGRLRSLESSTSTYHALTWRKKSSDLAVYRTTAPAGGDAPAGGGTASRGSGTPGETLLVWRAVAGAGTRYTLGKGGVALPDSFDLMGYTSPRWSDDGSAIGIGIQQRAEPSDTAAKASSDTASTVQIWRTTDVQVVPMQQSRSAGAARRTLLTVWNLASGKITRIGTKIDEGASLLEGWRHGVENVAEPYSWGTMFGRPYHDVYLTDVATGSRAKLLEKVRYASPSGGGRYLLLFDGKDYSSHEIATGKRTNLTAGLATSFADLEYDTPTDMTPPYGSAGWLTDDSAVLLYDRYDIWRISPDGSRRVRLTSGAANQVVHRVQRLSFDTPTIDPRQPIVLALQGERDKKSGYARLLPNGQVQSLILADKRISQLRKADSAERYVYRSEDRATPPEMYLTGADFTNPRQITQTNSFLKDFAWTREELVDFTSEAGVPLQGVLLYPANYEAGKKYPMIVYTYELLSDGLHSWQAPSERSYYNFTTWTLNGYFVLMPDIVFRARDPGLSTLESVRAGVKAVVDRGLVDPKRVGHVGHSMGGYEAAFLGTHGGDFLATTIAGASITDLVSFMGQIHWNGGLPESSHSETGQLRMEVAPWEDVAAHERNSPLHNVHNMTIPMLMAHGNKDGTVEFFQATEFYNFARRAGKDVVLLVYDGEDHGFRQKANQIDYHRRILEWFGHYLKGEPAPAWITEGVKLADTPAEAKRVAEKGKVAEVANPRDE